MLDDQRIAARLAHRATPGCTPHHWASVASNIWTKYCPTSRTTHSSTTSQRKLPYPSAETDHSASRAPSCSGETMSGRW
ncbi:MAG: hypothetical protein V8Q28_01645 [Alistipes sp.]